MLGTFRGVTPHTFPIRGAVTTTVLLNDGKLTGQS